MVRIGRGGGCECGERVDVLNDERQIVIIERSGRRLVVIKAAIPPP